MWVQILLLLLKLQILRVLGKVFFEIQATIECRFTLKCIRDMIITYSQMHCTGKYSQHNSITWPYWLNSWVFVYKLNGCRFESGGCYSSRISFYYITNFAMSKPYLSCWQGGSLMHLIFIIHSTLLDFTKSSSLHRNKAWSQSPNKLLTEIHAKNLLTLREGVIQLCHNPTTWNRLLKDRGNLTGNLDLKPHIT